MLTNLLHTPRLIIYLLLITSVAHLFPAILSPLTVDEAHYALYGQHLDWSYFDHPPLVGWLQALALQLGHHEWQLRLFALVSYAVSLWLIYRYTLQISQQQSAANIAALLFVCMPLVHLLGIGLVPDTLLLPIVLALFWQAQRTLTTPLWRNWILLGFLIGLAALSKYTSLLLAIGLVLMLCISQGVHWLGSLKFWTSVTIAGLMSLPILGWNLQHDWISINYQLNHGQPNTLFDWARLGQSQLSQLLLYTPFIWFGAWSLMLSWRAYRQNSIHRQLVAFSLPALVVFTLSSGKEPSLPHWLAFFYVLWLPFIAQSVIQHTHRWQTALNKLNITYGLFISVSLLILAVNPKLTQTWSPNPTQDLIGWKSAGQLAHHLQQTNEPLLVTHWVEASRIAWYAQPAPVIVLDDRLDQFDLWFGSPQANMNGLLILSPETEIQPWLSRFQQCQHLADSDEHFHFYRCQGFISP